MEAVIVKDSVLLPSRMCPLTITVCTRSSATLPWASMAASSIASAVFWANSGILRSTALTIRPTETIRLNLFMGLLLLRTGQVAAGPVIHNRGVVLVEGERESRTAARVHGIRCGQLEHAIHVEA